jgi:hypothetical protein
MNSLAGVQIVKNGIKYDYCFEESILSMLGCCDHVVIAYVVSEDATLTVLKGMVDKYPTKMTLMILSEDDWNFYQDKHRLSYITNAAVQMADKMGFTYILSVQSDEVIHQDSYESIRKIVAKGEHDAYMCTRINLWKTPYLELNVPQERMPCSKYVIRLARSCYRTYDDAESFYAPATFDYVDDIVMYHMGFVRKKEVMKSKIINMQCDVFGMLDYDKKLNECEVFNPDLWFNPITDLIPIKEELPKLIKKWAKERK